MAVEITGTSANFVGTGVLSDYTPEFYARTSDQVKVYVDGVLATLGDDYTVANLDSQNGVTISATFPIGAAVYIERVTPITQEVDTQNNETILEDVLDGEFDKLTMIDQEQQGQLDRTIKVPKGESGSILPAIASRIGRFLGFDAQGDAVALSGTGADAGLRTDLASSLAGTLLIAWKTAGTGAVLRTLYAKLRDLPMSPEDFGATGDGTTDDTAALKAWLAVLCAGELVGHGVGRKVYAITAGGGDVSNGILRPTKGVVLYGNRATIKIRNGSTPYGSIIGQGDGAVDLSGMWIEGWKFDHNVMNEAGPFTAPGGVFAAARQTFGFRRAKGVTFHDNWVMNEACVNSFWAVDNCSAITVTFNRWTNIGLVPGNVYSDHSTIYAVGDNMRITDNTFDGTTLAPSWLGSNAVCAIEAHPGTNCLIARNTVRRYHTGINMAGVGISDGANVSIIDNQFEVSRHAIVFFSSAYSTHTSGYGLIGVEVTGNVCRIRNAQAKGVMTGGQAGCGGITTNLAFGLPVLGINVHHNTLIYDLETSSPDYLGAVALGILQTAGAGATIDYVACHFDDNIVVNAPGAVAYLGGGGGKLHDCTAVRNRAVNPRSGFDTPALGDQRVFSASATEFTGRCAIGGTCTNINPTKINRPLVMAAGNASVVRFEADFQWISAPSVADFQLFTTYTAASTGELKVRTTGKVSTLGDYSPFNQGAEVTQGSEVYATDTNKAYRWNNTGKAYALFFNIIGGAPTFNNEPLGSVITRVDAVAGQGYQFYSTGVAPLKQITTA